MALRFRVKKMSERQTHLGRSFSQLARLGLVYESTPYSHSAVESSVIGASYLGSVLFGNAAFGTVRTVDPNPNPKVEEPF